MIIKREINGNVIEIKLTDDELYSAYIEKQGIFDEDDVRDIVYSLDDDELEDMYGISRHDIEPIIPEIAREMRWNINRYDMSWQDARDAAMAKSCETMRRDLERKK